MPDVEVTRIFAAKPEAVWSLVSDPTRMGEWSPENTGAEWIKGADGPAVGAKFRGSNARGRMKWKTTYLFPSRSAKPLTLLAKTKLPPNLSRRLPQVSIRLSIYLSCRYLLWSSKVSYFR